VTAPWQEFSDGLETDVLALIGADDYLKASGTYGVLKREIVPAIADWPPVLHKNILPYVGVVVTATSARVAGARSWAFPVKVGIHAADRENPPSEARERVRAMALRAVKIIADLSGTKPTTTAHVVTFVSSEIGKAATDPKDSTLVRIDAVVDFDLWYHD
jgi:hypothetical protein